MELVYKVGDFCPMCKELGLSKRMRSFHINLEEQIVKCESDECMYPYEVDEEDGGDFPDDLRAEKPLEPASESVATNPLTYETADGKAPEPVGASNCFPVNIDLSFLDLSQAAGDESSARPPIEIQSVQIIEPKPQTSHERHTIKAKEASTKTSQPKDKPPSEKEAAQSPRTPPSAGDVPKLHITRFLDVAKMSAQRKQPKSRSHKRLPDKVKIGTSRGRHNGDTDGVGGGAAAAALCASEVQRLMQQRSGKNSDKGQDQTKP